MAEKAMESAPGLQDLVSLAIGSPEVGAVNFTVLQNLLQEIIKNLKTEKAVNVGTTAKSDGEKELGEEAKAGNDTTNNKKSQEPTATSPMDETGQLKEAVKVKEDVAQAMTLLQDLMEQIKALKESKGLMEIQMKELTEGGLMQDLKNQLIVKAEHEKKESEDLKKLLKDMENIQQRLTKLEEVSTLHPAPDQTEGPTPSKPLEQTSETTPDIQISHPTLSPDSDIPSKNMNEVEALRRLEKLSEENARLVERLEELEKNKADRTELPRGQGGGPGLILSVDLNIQKSPQNGQHVLAGSQNVDQTMERSSQIGTQIEALKTSVEELGKELEKMKAKQEHDATKLKQMEEQKADTGLLKWKVNLTEFEASVGQLKAMVQDLQMKVSGLEKWQMILEKVNVEMYNKLDRVELEPFKRQMEEEWRVISKTLQDHLQEYETDGSAVIRKQLNTKFNCLCCNRPLEMKAPGPQLVNLPTFAPFPARRTNQRLAGQYMARIQQRN